MADSLVPPPKKSRKDRLLQWGAKGYAWFNAKRKERALTDKVTKVATMAAVGAAATAAVAATAVGYKHLNDRVSKVEARPVPNVKPLQARAQQLADSVESLRQQAATLSSAIKDLSASAGVDSKQSSDIDRMAGDVAKSAATLQELSGRIQQAAKDSSAVGDQAKEQAALIKSLASTLSDTANSVSESINQLSDKSDESFQRLDANADQIAKISDQIKAISTSLNSLANDIAAAKSDTEVAQKAAEDARAAADEARSFTPTVIMGSSNASIAAGSGIRVLVESDFRVLITGKYWVSSSFTIPGSSATSNCANMYQQTDSGALTNQSLIGTGVGYKSIGSLLELSEGTHHVKFSVAPAPAGQNCQVSNPFVTVQRIP